MSTNFKQAIEGTGVGLFAGLVIGLSDMDWLRLSITAALIAYAGNALNQAQKSEKDNSLKIAFLGIMAFGSILIGLYINEQKLFKQSPKDGIAYWTNAGYTPAQAREMWLKQSAIDFQTSQNSTSKAQNSIQNSAKPFGVDTLITSRLDSLQALISKLLGDNSTISLSNQVSSLVSSNLFSSSQSQNLCSQLDPDASSSASAYFTVIEKLNIAELNELTIKDTTINPETRYEFSKLLWDMICTVESDKKNNWVEITEPKNKNAETMHQIYTAQENPVFSKISAWVKQNVKDQDEYFRKLNALIKKVF